MSPRDLTNQQFFRAWLPMLFYFPGILIPGAFSVFFLLGLASRWRVWTVLAGICLALFVPFAFLTEHGLSALESFGARTLSVTLLPPLLLLAVAVHTFAPELAGFRKALLAGMVLATVSLNIRHTADWEDYRAGMKKVLATASGYVPVESTELDHHPCRWAWASPELSVVWSYPDVRAIVENRTNVDWQPFDPRKRLPLKRYVRYDAVFSGVDRAAR